MSDLSLLDRVAMRIAAIYAEEKPRAGETFDLFLDRAAREAARAVIADVVADAYAVAVEVAGRYAKEAALKGDNGELAAACCIGASVAAGTIAKRVGALAPSAPEPSIGESI